MAQAMLSRLFKKTAVLRPIDTARVPDGMRIYAIGDIHGRDDLLNALLTQIEADDLARGAADTQIIFLGDLVDRGPGSAAVVETALALKTSGRNVRFLMGNHEEVFVSACRKGDPKVTRFFLRIGGEATVLSYPITRYLGLVLAPENSSINRILMTPGPFARIFLNSPRLIAISFFG
jgi:serine/threonine protein phosphatase 1